MIDDGWAWILRKAYVRMYTFSNYKDIYIQLHREKTDGVCMSIYEWRGKKNEEEKERWFLWSDMTNKGEDLHMLNREREKKKDYMNQYWSKLAHSMMMLLFHWTKLNKEK
jgi:hypothetical protein